MNNEKRFEPLRRQGGYGICKTARACIPGYNVYAFMRYFY